MVRAAVVGGDDHVAVHIGEVAADDEVLAAGEDRDAGLRADVPEEVQPLRAAGEGDRAARGRIELHCGETPDLRDVAGRGHVQVAGELHGHEVRVAGLDDGRVLARELESAEVVPRAGDGDVGVDPGLEVHLPDHRPRRGIHDVALGGDAQVFAAGDRAAECREAAVGLRARGGHVVHAEGRAADVHRLRHDVSAEDYTAACGPRLHGAQCAEAECAADVAGDGDVARLRLGREAVGLGEQRVHGAGDRDRAVEIGAQADAREQHDVVAVDLARVGGGADFVALELRDAACVGDEALRLEAAEDLGDARAVRRDQTEDGADGADRLGEGDVPRAGIERQLVAACACIEQRAAEDDVAAGCGEVDVRV